MNILEEIAAHKTAEIAQRQREMPVDRLETSLSGQPAVPDFCRALHAAPMGLIAEVKRRSPSAGLIREPFDPPSIARSYREGGAQAISVLMDERYFGGGETDFRAVRRAVDLPLLYKEFVIDPWQIVHAAALGASAVLLIVALLKGERLRRYMAEIARYGMVPLVEVHDEEEMQEARDAGAVLIGVNNRNLRDFTVSLETTLRLRAMVPAQAMLISESGIRTPDDVCRLHQAGVAGILVGEQLLRDTEDPAAAVRQLMGGVRA